MGTGAGKAMKMVANGEFGERLQYPLTPTSRDISPQLTCRTLSPVIRERGHLQGGKKRPKLVNSARLVPH
jgi:hypothetical protein